MISSALALSLLPLLSGTASAALLPRQSKICGAKGYDRGNGNFEYEDSGKHSTYATCSQYCLSNSKCLSFGISGKACLLFDRVLSGNFDADSGSTDTYWDRSCVTASTTASIAATATTSTTIKAATTTATTTSSKVPTTTATNTKAATTSATTTSKAATTTTRAATTTSTTTAAATPACSGISNTIQITTFNWFNSTHNLDCANPNYPAGATVCWDGTKNIVCADGDPSCTCTPFCSTGTTTAAYQPLGYGPPDSINIAFNGASQGCSAKNAQSIRRYEIGEGHFDCGTAADVIGFYGDSNKDTGNIGSVYYNPYGANCNGKQVRYEGSFPLICSRDAGMNATCTAQLPVTLNLVS